MSYYQQAQSALDARLASLTGGVAIAWPNIGYTPVRGTPFIRPTMLLANAFLMNLADIQLNPGIYQIDVFYPVGNGPGAVLNKLDAIYDHFKGTIKLTASGVDVHIKEISVSAPTQREEAWYMGTVSINFKIYSN